MKYLCLICNDEKAFDALPAAEQERVVAEHQAFAAELQQRGQLIAGEALQPVSTAVTVRIAGGKSVVSDGPFAETKEQMGGFYLIEARDLTEATQIAQRIPHAGFGSVEVRPVWEIPTSG